MARTLVDSHPLSTHVIVFAFSLGTKNTNVGEEMSRVQASARVVHEITSHLPWSRRVRSQRQTRLACGINSEAAGGFYHKKYDSSSPHTLWIAFEAP